MLRLPPFDKIGVTPTPDFTNADPTNSVPGSIVNGHVFNILQHEGENLALGAGLTPSGADLTQWAQAASRRGLWCGTLTGTGDIAMATLGVMLPALLQGMGVGAVATATNTTTTPKLRLVNYGSAGLQQDFPIIKADGSALAVGDIKVGRIYRYEADGAGNVMISGGGIGSGAGGAAAIHGRVQLQLASSTSIVLAPRNGNGVVVAGALAQIPAAGITAGTTGVRFNATAGSTLPAQSVCLVTVNATGALGFWQTGSGLPAAITAGSGIGGTTYGRMADTTAGNVGVQVLAQNGAPVSAETIVGVVYTGAGSSAQFQDADGARYLLSWFERQPKKGQTAFSAFRTTTATTLTELNTEIRNFFLCWGGDTVAVDATGTCSSANSSSAGYNYKQTGIAFDGGSAEFNQASSQGGYNANDPIPFAIVEKKAGLAEGLHFVTLMGGVETSTGTWYAVNTITPTSGNAAACQITVTVNG